MNTTSLPVDTYFEVFIYTQNPTFTVLTQKIFKHVCGDPENVAIEVLPGDAEVLPLSTDIQKRIQVFGESPKLVDVLSRYGSEIYFKGDDGATFRFSLEPWLNSDHETVRVGTCNAIAYRLDLFTADQRDHWEREGKV